MTKIRVRYLTTRPPGKSGVIRYFWQPWTEFQKQGWPARRVPDNWQDFADDPVALESAAIAEAQRLNAELDAWREAQGRPAPEPSATPAAIAEARPPRPPVAQPRSLDKLIADYRTSLEFRKLRPATRRAYGQNLDVLSAWGGPQAARAITTPRLRKLYKALYERTPAKAAAVMRVAQILFSYARLEGWVIVNPASKMGLVGAPPSGRLWPREAVALFVRAADDLGYFSMGTAVMLDEWLGQREADVLRLSSGILDPLRQRIRQAKTGAGVLLPVDMVAHLVERVDAQLERNKRHEVASTRLIVTDDGGQPYKPDWFRHVFAAVRARAIEMRLEAKGWQRRDDGAWRHAEPARRLTADASPAELAAAMRDAAVAAASFETDYVVAGADPDDPAAYTVRIADLQFMHLRHTAVTRFAEAGCTVPEIAALTGHKPKSVEQILDRYLVRTGDLARAAFTKRLAAERGATPEPPENAVRGPRPLTKL